MIYDWQSCYPVCLKKRLSSSQRDIDKQPWENPNNSELFLTNGLQCFPLPSVSYMTLSCKVPPNLIFNGEKAAKYQSLWSVLNLGNIRNCSASILCRRDFFLPLMALSNTTLFRSYKERKNINFSNENETWACLLFKTLTIILEISWAHSTYLTSRYGVVLTVWDIDFIFYFLFTGNLRW